MPKWDTRASKYIQRIGIPTMKFWTFVARFGVYIYLVLYLIFVYEMTQKYRAVLVIIPILATLAIALLHQYIIRRPRPVATKTQFRLWLPTYSFPSAHSAISFAFATSFSFLILHSSAPYPWLFIVFFYLLAMCIAISRVVVGVHYLSDVTIGALLGVIISVMLSTL